MTNEEAREYFKAKGLTYDVINNKNINILLDCLNQHVKQAVKEKKCDTLRISKKVRYQTYQNCYTYVNGGYFKKRECISFNADGFIGFAGWAGTRNAVPIISAFIEWCDIIAGGKEE